METQHSLFCHLSFACVPNRNFNKSFCSLEHCLLGLSKRATRSVIAHSVVLIPRVAGDTATIDKVRTSVIA